MNMIFGAMLYFFTSNTQASHVLVIPRIIKLVLHVINGEDRYWHV